ncbi:MAG TPA: AAA family ATPase [Acidimicrobiia bacterium]|nr:AAA family ATPase [Acidimicrobiia bacterium]
MNELTILFTDVEGSTELLSREGDLVAGEILGVHEEIVRSQITRFGGTEEAFLGDGFMATFQTPAAGLACSIQIQRGLHLHNQTAARPVRVRIGLHHGEVTRRGGQIYGRAVHAAARIMAEAAGGEILASAALQTIVTDDPSITFADRGLFWLKGFPQRWRLYQVSWATPEEQQTPGALKSASAPFVGRDTERADLRRAFRTAIGGSGSLILVAGEAGVGKTRLIEEVAAEAEGRGMRVLVGHSVEMEGAAPYLPLVEILEEALTSSRSPIAFREALGDLAPELARLVPGLRRLYPDMPAPLDIPPEQSRRYLWDTVADFIRRASQVGPLMLVFEDLHWGDESTFHFLEYLAPLLAEMPVLVVGSYRDTEVGPSHLLARTIGELTRRRLVNRTSLVRLTTEEVTAMLAGLANQDPPPGLVRAIQRETEGNPFFIEEVYLHLRESGGLFDEEGRFKSRYEIDEVDVPETVRLVIGGRLERLSAGTREVLLAAAISGRIFDPEVVRRVVGSTGQALAGAFEEAEDARLIGPNRGDSDRLAFVHELIRQTLLADASSFRRQQLHADTAQAIEEVYVDRIEDHAADLAHHLSHSGPRVEPIRLVRYLEIAGDRAVQAAAYEDGVAYFRHALSLVDDSDRDRRAELLERLAMAERSVGEWEQALQTMDRSLELYQELGRNEDIGRVCWSVVYQLAWAARFEEAVGVAQRGLQALGELANADRARLLSATAWVVGLAGDHATATAMFEGARQLAEQLGDRRALADVLHMETAHHMGYVEFVQGIEAGLRAANVFEQEGALWDRCSVLAFVAYQQGTMGRTRDARASEEAVSSTASRIGHLGAQFLLMADRIRQEGAMLGDLPAMETLARETIEICERGRLPWLYAGYLYLGFAADWAGRRVEGEGHLRQALDLEPPGAFTGQTASLLAIHLAEMGRAEEVQALFERNRASLPAEGRVNSLGAWNTLFGFTEALYLAGAREQAAGLLPLVRQSLDLGIEWMTFDCHLVHTRVGIAAVAAGEWEEAEEHFATALRLAEQIDQRVEQADLRYLKARMLHDRGKAGDAEEMKLLIDEAVERYRNMGLIGKAELAAALL